MSGKVDLEVLRRLPRQQYALPPDFETRISVQVDGPTWDAILAALERAERVEAAARPLAERCWNRRVVAVRDPDEVAWTICGICPPCKLRAALESEP